MRHLLARLFDLRAGEGTLLAKSTLVLFGLIASHTMLETARDALFLGRLPAHRLTFVYVLLAGLALVVSRLNSRFVSRFGRRNALIFTLFAAAYGTTILYLLPTTNAVVFGIYVWSGLLGSVLVVQFWMFAGHGFNVAQGKRLFPPITAGGVLGAVTGAAFSVGALRWLEVRHLLAVGAGLFLLTAMLLTTVVVEGDTVSTGASDTRERRSIVQVFRQEPYLTRLALLVALSTATLLTTDYLFKSVVRATYAPEELGAFFASYYAILNSFALVVQLLVAGAIVRRAGVIAAFAVLPALLLFGSIGTLLFGGVMLAVLLTKGAEGSLRHSLHRISAEILWMPLPDQVRTDSKVIVDTVFVRGAQAATAGGLLLLATFDLDTPMLLGGILAILSLGWIVLTVGLRKPYLGLFRRALHRETPLTLERRLDLDIRSVEVVVEALSSRDSDRAIAAIELLVSSRRSRLIPALILYHESADVLERALPAVGLPDRKDWIPLAERLLEHASEAVRIAALRALAGAGITSAIEQRLLDIEPRVRAHAAFWLANGNDDIPVREQPGVKQILEMGDAAGVSAKVGILEAIEGAGDLRWSDVILELCPSDHPRIIEAAVLAMARVKDQRFIPLLIERLHYRTHRAEIRDAIVAMGEPALGALVETMRDDRTDRHLVKHIPRTISKFGTQRAADILQGLLVDETPGIIRYKVLRGLGQLVAENPVRVDRGRIERRLETNLVEYLRMMAFAARLETMAEDADASVRAGRSLLLGFIEGKQEQALERAFRLLQIVHRKEDIRSVAFAVKSPHKGVRAQALEYLDALTLDAEVPAIRELLRIVVDDLPVEDRLARASSYLPPLPKTAEDAIGALLRDPDVSVANVAGYHALQLGLENLRNEVIEVTHERPVLASLKAILDALRPKGAPSVA